MIESSATTRAELTRPWGPAQGEHALSATERRIAVLIVEGTTNREMASQLRMPRTTVDAHVRRIFRKLGVRSRLELVRLSERALAAPRILAAADDARRRIERDLHDGLQQDLVTLCLRLRTAEAAIPSHHSHVKRELGQLAEALQDVFDRVRHISQGIHPAILSKAGLVPALKGIARRSPLPVQLHIGLDRRLGEPVELAAYYVASEALANVAKHAQATEVTVSLAERGGSLHLSVQDDGIGGAKADGTGLTGLNERVTALEGSLQVISRPGAGTLVHLELPLR
jgi:signal transduction histidine kinase